jgi:EAL domain-containing protein (putative c-di-GMP-specific phosphodiesterase class I)/GGDEF domain-containing protein
MYNYSYKSKILISYFLIISIVVFLLINLFIVTNSSDVGQITQKNMYNKALEREKFFHSFFKPYFSSINAVTKNKNLKNSLTNGIDYKYIQNYFISLHDSLPNLRQIRYLDFDGNEIIRVNSSFLNSNDSLKKTIEVVPQNKLQNKKETQYFKKFKELNIGEVGISKIELNKEFGKITLPKQPVVRLGMILTDNDKNKIGIIIYNISLRELFKNLDDTVLYHTHLIDKNGSFLSHHNPNHGLIGKDMNYNLYDEFPEYAYTVLSEDSYYLKNFYSFRIRDFNNGQNIKMVLEPKFLEEVEQTQKTQNNFVWLSILFSVVLLPVIIYFSKLPDFLRDKANKEQHHDKLTGLPNRVTLVNDLLNKKFPSSTIVILISINNLLKIQSTYGFKISDEVVKTFHKMLNSLDEENILKIYSNNYSTFTINFEYTDYGSFKNFIDFLVNNLESCSFTLNDEEFDFLLDITLGISNPHKLNYGIEELSEAENALEIALSKNKPYDIFDAEHNENIKTNKENIQLARKIKNAIEQNGLILHYQPIFNNQSKKIEKYECLARIKDGDELIYPNIFLPISKQINKYNNLSFLIIDRAFEYFKDKSVEFSINLSILDITNIDLQKYLFEKIEEFDVKDRLVIEIVEQEGIANYTEFISFLEKIREYGCKVAIDDFGSGYSNFDYIVKMSDYIDYLKIDGSLIKGINTNPKTQLLVGTLKFLCDNLRIKVIAEFIEDKETFEIVVNMGVVYCQGYYIGEPQDKIKEENNE